jgi:hypothetical protein
MARQSSQGTCCLCQSSFSKGAMTRHLAKCVPAHESARAAAEKMKEAKVFRIVVEGKYNKSYWLYLDMPATSQLGDLDQFLRRIWLECCGHMSAFRSPKKTRPRALSMAQMLAAGPMDWQDPDELNMEDKVGTIFHKGLTLSYEYDFGSTTALSVKIVDEHEGLVPKGQECRLLARNDPPHIPCGRCKEAEATIIDTEKVYDKSGWLCARCAAKARLDEDMTLPVVNSPRTGVCAYTGD